MVIAPVNLSLVPELRELPPSYTPLKPVALSSVASSTEHEFDSENGSETHTRDSSLSSESADLVDEASPEHDEAPQILTPVEYITANMIGRNVLFETPFGMKAQCYADFTASGKPLQCVEDFVQKDVLPLYGNTHTSSSVTGLQMTSFREDARRAIAHAVNAKIDRPDATDCVLFTGQGTTSAINKLVTMLELTKYRARKYTKTRPVVFVGPFEHHSNILPWRESGAKVVIIPEDDDGKVCIATLTEKLKRYSSRPLKIGSFSAASNLTGILSDVDAISTVLHQYGALAFFDYATCGAYVKIDMNPETIDAYKDGIFVSGHKFIGGPGASGLLVVKSKLVDAKSSPTMPGGGTVLFVTHSDHRYVSNNAEREEGGTPDILGNIRLGLAFQVKERVGDETILRLEHANFQRVHESLRVNKRIMLLGRFDIDRLPIFSFLVRFGDRFLHYNFVCALLNDLFGVQTRGGCQCAGPYAARLLGVKFADLNDFKDALVDHQEALKPGFTRLSFPYFMDASEVEYILKAVHFVANEGWKFLPQYQYSPATGSWTHVSRIGASPTIKNLGLFDATMEKKVVVKSSPLGMNRRSVASHREQNLVQARMLAEESVQRLRTEGQQQQQRHPNVHFQHLRWFAEPQDAVAAFKRGDLTPEPSLAICGPCQPQRYLLEGYPTFSKREMAKMWLQMVLKKKKKMMMTSR